MHVLVTGSNGFIGRELIKYLKEAGHEVSTFDRCARRREDDWQHIPGDIRDTDAVRKAVDGVDAVAHLGAIADARSKAAEEIFNVNVGGTHNVLLACKEANVNKVVYFSSVNALGAVGGHRETLYLPINDAYPHTPMTHYQLSKHLGEEICSSYSDRYGIQTICLRPVFVAPHDRYHYWKELGSARQSHWGKGDYWAYVDVRDVCRAAVLSLASENIQHDGFLLAAKDVTLDTPTADLMKEFYPDAKWGDLSMEEWLKVNPYRTLIDTIHAKDLLGWEPVHSWRDE